MFLISGLGNPGKEYEQTRHNVGFLVIDALAEAYGPVSFQEKFHSHIAKCSIAGHEVWLQKPLTYMNRSGKAVQACAQFYKVPTEHIIAIHDEIDLIHGKLRCKRGGGIAGHNGLRSINEYLSNSYMRIRIGVDHPGHKDQVSSYVLGKMKEEERIIIDQQIERLVHALPALLSDGEEAFYQKL